ncbi:MAG TPA: hypothetical protein VF414_06065 [Thermoanaerobaculia bacterium]
MPSPTLVLSHPPHGEVDFKRAGTVLGLVAVDVRLKASYGVPEIWLADEDPGAAEAAAAALRQAGLSVVLVPGAALGAIAPANPVSTFRFEAGGLLLQAEEEVLLEYDTPGLAVLFIPRPGQAKDLLPPASLDLYALTGIAAPRWTIVQGVTTFEGMGPRQSSSFGANVRNLAAEVEQRFPAMAVDRRLLNMQVRRRTGLPPAGAPVRQGYSFATAALARLLESIEPGLSELEHEELAVRLALLTRAAG